MINRRRRRAPLASLVALAALVLGACSAAPAGTTGPSADFSGTTGPSADQYGTNCPTSQPPALGAGETRTVALATSLGTITLKISADLSPIAAGNFVALASCGYYDGVVFHRVVPGFVIQGGDPTGTGRGGPGYTIQDEPVTTTYHRGTLAMARTPAANSQGSQFFIVLDDGAAGSLANANTYAIFGEVSAGMDTVDAIAAAADAELPSQPIAMTRVIVTNP